MARRNTAAIVAEVELIRKLVKEYGVMETARRTGRSHASVSHIKNGLRHAETGALTINALGLRRCDNKMCRRCGDRMTLVTVSFLCVNCHLVELGKKGVIKIDEKEVSSAKE